MVQTTAIALGPLGARSAQDRQIVAGLTESWRRFKVVNEWYSRIENYCDPSKRGAQLATDSVDFPLKFLDALGFETKSIPLTKLWSAEIEFLIEFLRKGSQAQIQAAEARQKWADAARIAKELGPRAQHAIVRSRAPHDKSYVWKWDSIVRWSSRHAHDQRFTPGIFASQGYDPFLASSLAELRLVAEGCQLRIFRHAGRLAFVYLLLRVQQATLMRLASGSLQSLESMVEGKNVIAQIVGATTAMSLTVAREGATDRAFSDPVGYTSGPMSELEKLAKKWLSAAAAAHAWGTIL